MTGSESLPAITVYTDTTKREPINQGRAPFSHTLDIIIEMSLGGAGGEIETDAELEGKLDVFEEQVLAALFDITRPYALAFGKMFKKILGADSLRLANNDGATRLAMRDLMIQVEYDQRCADFTAAFSPLETVWQLNETKGEEVALTHANVGEV
ncbi:hypothetical protein [Sulfitobacter sp. 1A15106]|uniref:hypothetical protein n=1 Tax=Sulfitobacter sp. 1A15106 TaxID=3368590 RepID=UPI003745663E